MARPSPTRLTFCSAALAASRVGTWELDVPADLVRCDATMAALYGLSPDEGEAGVPLTRLRAAIHPEDRSRGIAKHDVMLREGGLFVIEYRTTPRPHEERWVLVRGCYEADEVGCVVVGRGIVIDVTDSKQDGYAEGRAHFLSADLSFGASNPLDRVAELALQARRAVDHVSGTARADLRPSIDALLMKIGRQIARQLSRSDLDADDPPVPPERRH